MISSLNIKRLEKYDPVPYHLLLLADPSKKNIDKYISDAAIYAVKKEALTIGCYVLHSVDTDTIEVKNIAVDPAWQRKGIGMHLLNHAAEEARANGFKHIIIGTGNSSVGQLYLYQKAGFRIINTIKDFFINNYDEPIFENGIECRDMIILKKDLVQN